MEIPEHLRSAYGARTTDAGALRSDFDRDEDARAKRIRRARGGDPFPPDPPPIEPITVKALAKRAGVTERAVYYRLKHDAYFRALYEDAVNPSKIRLRYVTPEYQSSRHSEDSQTHQRLQERCVQYATGFKQPRHKHPGKRTWRWAYRKREGCYVFRPEPAHKRPAGPEPIIDDSKPEPLSPACRLRIAAARVYSSSFYPAPQNVNKWLEGLASDGWRKQCFGLLKKSENKIEEFKNHFFIDKLQNTLPPKVAI